MSLKTTTSSTVNGTGYLLIYPSDGPTYTLHHSKLELHLKLALQRMNLQEVELTQLRAKSLQQLMQISDMGHENDELQLQLEEQRAQQLQQAQQLRAQEQQIMQLQSQLQDKDTQLSKQQQLIEQQSMHVTSMQEQLDKYNYLKPHIERTIKNQMQQIENYQTDKIELQQQCEKQLLQLGVLDKQLTALKAAQHGYIMQSPSPFTAAAKSQLRASRQPIIAVRRSCDARLVISSSAKQTMQRRASADVPRPPASTRPLSRGASQPSRCDRGGDDICFSWLEPTESIAKQLSSTPARSRPLTASQTYNGRSSSKWSSAATARRSLVRSSSTKLRAWWLSASAAASAAAHRVQIACLGGPIKDLEMQALPGTCVPQPV